jgi:hypothetical protein
MRAKFALLLVVALVGCDGFTDQNKFPGTWTCGADKLILEKNGDFTIQSNASGSPKIYHGKYSMGSNEKGSHHITWKWEGERPALTENTIATVPSNNVMHLSKEADTNFVTCTK